MNNDKLEDREFGSYSGDRELAVAIVVSVAENIDKDERKIVAAVVAAVAIEDTDILATTDCKPCSAQKGSDNNLVPTSSACCWLMLRCLVQDTSLGPGSLRTVELRQSKRLKINLPFC